MQSRGASHAGEFTCPSLELSCSFSSIALACWISAAWRSFSAADTSASAMIWLAFCFCMMMHQRERRAQSYVIKAMTWLAFCFRTMMQRTSNVSFTRIIQKAPNQAFLINRLLRYLEGQPFQCQTQMGLT